MNFHMPIEMNLLGKKPYYNCCIGMVSPQNESSYAGQDCPFVKKLFLQLWHWYGFSPVWVFICLSRILFCEKAFSHLLHWYGFSPVWTLIWRSWVAFSEFFFFYNCCIGMVSLQYEFSYADRDEPFGKKPYYNYCIGMVSPQNEVSYAGQDCPFVKKLFLHSWHWFQGNKLI